MEDLQNEVQNNENENGNEYQQYIDTITEIKKNSVPKEKYEKLEKQNADLITALKEGNQVNLVDEPEEESIDELRDDLYGDPDKSMTNLEYVSKTLKLRAKLIEAGEPDPFLPNGQDYQINETDINTANMIAEQMQECVDYANGDDQLFTQELMRRTKDDSPLKKAQIRKK